MKMDAEQTYKFRTQRAKRENNFYFNECEKSERGHQFIVNNIGKDEVVWVCRDCGVVAISGLPEKVGKDVPVEVE